MTKQELYDMWPPGSIAPELRPGLRFAAKITLAFAIDSEGYKCEDYELPIVVSITDLLLHFSLDDEEEPAPGRGDHSLRI